MSQAYLRYDQDNLTGFPAPENYRAQILYFAKTLYTAPKTPIMARYTLMVIGSVR